MAFDPAERRVYVSRRRDARISTLTVEPDGSLTPVGELQTPSGACYVSTDRTGRFLLSAYYADGAVAVHAIGDDGVAAGPPLCQHDTGAGAHILETDRTNRWAFSCTIAEPVGSNAVHQFLFDERTGSLRPNTPPRLIGENGCGPRHFCFHPRLPLVYVSNEQGGSVTAYRLDTGTGTLTRWHTVSTLPSGYTVRTPARRSASPPTGPACSPRTAATTASPTSRWTRGPGRWRCARSCPPNRCRAPASSTPPAGCCWPPGRTRAASPPTGSSRRTGA